MGVKTVPVLLGPKVGSNWPVGVYRARPKSLVYVCGDVFGVGTAICPPRTIAPSGCTTTLHAAPSYRGPGIHSTAPSPLNVVSRLPSGLNRARPNPVVF